MGRRMTGSHKCTVAALVVSLAVSLLVVAPGPARAGSGPDHLTPYTACLGPATNSAGYVDTVGHIAEAAIDCLAYYGITSGTDPDRFSPDQPITRWQMALFLVRAAGPAGITLPAPVDQGFTDLEGKAQNIQDAINQVAVLGISRGTSPTTFHPDAQLDRRQMALFLYRFLRLGSGGPGGADATAVVPDPTPFEDLAGQPDSVVDAVGVIYEMGVTAGRTATTFAPQGLVTRAQMALFLTRALAHTNARPKGTHIQSPAGFVASGDTLEVQISVRDDQFRPTGQTRVDLFSTPIKRPHNSFDPDGNCLGTVEVVLGGKACVIDAVDQLLDAGGNLAIVLEPTKDLMLWAWGGALNDKFGATTTDSGSIEIEVLKYATALRVSDDMKPAAAYMKLGSSVVMGFQLVDDGGRPVAEPGVRVQLTTTYERNGVTGRTNIKTYRTGGDGKVSVAFPAPDPNAAVSGDSVTLDIDVTVQALEILDWTAQKVVANDADERKDALIEWSDAPPSATSLRLWQSAAYGELPDSGPSPVNVVRATLTDQYGDPVSNRTIEFKSNQEAGLGLVGASKVTDSKGMVNLRYLWDSSDASSELISAEIDDESVSASPVYHYWAARGNDGKSALGVAILLGDTARNTILHDIATPWLLRYDANDRFSIKGAVVTIEAFEDALSSGEYSRISYSRYSNDPAKVSSFDLNNSRIFDSA